MLEQEGKRSLWRWFLDFLIGYLPFLPVQMFILYDEVSQMEAGAGRVFAVASYICMVAVFSGFLSEFGCGLRKRWRKMSASEEGIKGTNDAAWKESPEVFRVDRVDLVGGDEYDLFVKYGLGATQYEDTNLSGETYTSKGQDSHLTKEYR